MTVKSYVVPDMPAADCRGWAKEEVLFAVDQGLAEKIRTALPDDLYPDDRHALLLQRNRVAKFLGLPQVDEIAEAVPVAEQLEDIAQRCRKAVADRIGLQVVLDATKAELADAKRERDDAVKALRNIEEEAKVANDVIRLNRDGQGQGRVRVATAMHRIAEWTRAALATEASR